MPNKVQFSLKNVHYAPMTTEEDGNVTYETPVHIPGAVSLSLSSQGSENKFIADGVVYYISYSNEGYSGTLTMALFPDHFRKAILMEREDPETHILSEYMGVETRPFALLFEIEGDQKGSRRILYSCTVGTPGEDADGQTQKNPKTEAMPLTAGALASGLTRTRTTDDTPKEVFDNWFKAVTLPSEDAGPQAAAAASLQQAEEA